MTSKLDQIVTGVRPGRYRYFFYGEWKSGKSTLAARAGDSIFIDLEGGLRFIKCAPYPLPKGDLTMAYVEEAITDLTENAHGYRHLWIDGLEILEALIHGVVVPEAARRAGKKWAHLDEIGGGFNKGARMALCNWRDLLNLLERLQDATGMAVGFLGHAKLGKRKDVGAVDWDCWAPNINDLAWHVLADWVDVFGFLGFEQGGTKDKENLFARGKGWQTGQRFIHTARSATHHAGRRFPMPDRIEMIHPDHGDPWAPFAHAIDMFMDSNAILQAITTELIRIDDSDLTTITKEWLEESRPKDQLVFALHKLRRK